MITLKHALTRLIAPVFLLPALSLQAQTTDQSTTTKNPYSPTPTPTTSCDALSGQTTGVQQRLDQYKHLVRGRQCIILNADPAENVDQLINQAPENAVILLSSNTAAPAVRTPSVSAFSGKTPVEYFVGSEIHLKNGQDILGAADDGLEIVLRDRPEFAGKHLIRVGSTDNFQFVETKASHIKHLTFQPTRVNSHPSIDTIVFAGCYNRRLVIEDNVFHLPARATLTLDCKKPLDASVSRPGPGLLFAKNTLIGTSFKQSGRAFIPEQGIAINLPAIRNQEGALAVTGNIFRGKMAEAGAYKLGSGTGININKNTVDIANYGNTGRAAFRKGGFALLGHTDTHVKPPVFNLAGNQIRVSATAITVGGRVGLALACNHLQAANTWWQIQQEFSLKAIPVSFAEVAERCENNAGSKDAGSNIAMQVQETRIQITNTWTATHYSTNTACAGLVNLEGQFFFGSEVCQTVNPPSNSSTPIPTTSNTTRPCMTGSCARDMTLLGVFAILGSVALVLTT
ncbi:hypothetical protein [Endozoicomonas sp. 4G]|uniref:hypothetical protein n=1 Tax=Endozoicomonas sp. 4G TaxID=2872754 RepID=UPI0020784EF5|nr:hypothetical protein [Endozoicomonas sp. 4G]